MHQRLLVADPLNEGDAEVMAKEMCMMNNFLMSVLLACSSGCAFAAQEGLRGAEACIENRIYARAMKAYEKGIAALERKDFGSAAQILDDGLGILGDAYLYEGLVDDTGMKLVLAEVEESKGAFEAAAKMKGRVLDSRLIAFHARIRCNEKPSVE
ncbi:hypothetical protein [Mitsuaria sp. 7]|uniref:hypothetical protein n=1 Tax=Mitsuaria sp. 7 TaxID=1658665 RepID=UPI0007DE313B|nr:hypothetical protein [Mitsuaria sp. 7]ANH67401.1 hypothetical protein ABE85_07145 [Mitsuaria sp. 7]